MLSQKSDRSPLALPLLPLQCLCGTGHESPRYAKFLLIGFLAIEAEYLEHNELVLRISKKRIRVAACLDHPSAVSHLHSLILSFQFSLSNPVDDRKKRLENLCYLETKVGMLRLANWNVINILVQPLQKTVKQTSLLGTVHKFEVSIPFPKATSSSCKTGRSFPFLCHTFMKKS